MRKNITTISIVIFFLIYGLINYIKPAFMYNSDGSLRQFGVGYYHKTIAPAWLISIIIAIISYFSVLYYISMPKISF